jgi:hypothetical protein
MWGEVLKHTAAIAKAQLRLPTFTRSLICRINIARMTICPYGEGIRVLQTTLLAVTPMKGTRDDDSRFTAR